MNKDKLISIYLRFLSIFSIVFWGLTHLFFPEIYLKIIGKPKSFLTQENLLMINDLGGMVIALGIALWFAAKDPVKNFLVVLIFYISGIISMAATAYHIIYRQASDEWLHIFIILFLLALLTLLYPWKKLYKHR